MHNQRHKLFVCRRPDLQDNLDNPYEIAMAAANRIGTVPSQGGWREFGYQDYTISYLGRLVESGYVPEIVASCLTKIQIDFLELTAADKSMIALWNTDLLADRFRFIPTLDEECMRYIVGTVGDPRWFFEPSQPNHAKRFMAYMGMSPRKSWPAHIQIRHEAAMSAWRMDRPTEKEAEKDPRHFLWRYFFKLLAAQSNEEDASIMTTKKFLRFVRETWIDHLSTRHRMMVSSYFFDNQDEADAHDKYLKPHRGQSRLANVREQS
jgi:hypothetical protein